MLVLILSYSPPARETNTSPESPKFTRVGAVLYTWGREYQRVRVQFRATFVVFYSISCTATAVRQKSTFVHFP